MTYSEYNFSTTFYTYTRRILDRNLHPDFVSCVTDICYCFIFVLYNLCLFTLCTCHIHYKCLLYYALKKFCPKSWITSKLSSRIFVWGAADVMNVKIGKSYLDCGSLMLHVMLATVLYRWGGFLPNNSIRCIECQNTHFCKPSFSI